MNDNLLKLIKDSPVFIPRILLNNYKKFGISDSELIMLISLIQYGDKILYNPNVFAVDTGNDKHEVMKLINSLCDKNILSMVIEKNGKVSCEYISLELLYEKIYNIVIDNDDKKEKKIDDSIFSVFENEIGRTLSPMEYEQIKDWVTNYDNELVVCALKEAVMNGVSNFRYIDTILLDWSKKGYKKKEDIIKDKNKYHSKKEKVSVYDTDWLNE